MTRSVEGQSEQLRKDICKEMEGVAAEMDVAFTTDFWTSPTAESFMTMSMHWIAQDWRLKRASWGRYISLRQHTAANISKKLMELRLDFGCIPGLVMADLPKRAGDQEEDGVLFQRGTRVE